MVDWNCVLQKKLQNNVMTKTKSSGTALPKFESQLHHILAVWPQASYVMLYDLYTKWGY